MAHPPPIVFVVDDDPAVRQAVESLLRSAGITAQSFASAREFLDSAPTDAPACVVLDVNLPGTSGLDLQRELTGRDPALPVIFITGYGDIPTSVRAMKAGAVEFLAKPFREEDLLNAIRQALDKSREAQRTRSESAELHGRIDSLTPRERQVLRFVIAGLLNKQIAYDLGISEVTVKVHRAHVMQKMKARSVADLVRIAERVGIPPAQS
ncbi:MAG: response regulator transcription factor [Candidatus Binatia bacterium]